MVWASFASCKGSNGSFEAEVRHDPICLFVRSPYHEENTPEGKRMEGLVGTLLSWSEFFTL